MTSQNNSSGSDSFIERTGKNAYVIVGGFAIIAILMPIVFIALYFRATSNDDPKWTEIVTCYATIAWYVLTGCAAVYLYLRHGKSAHDLQAKALAMQTLTHEQQKAAAEVAAGLALNVVLKTRLVKHGKDGIIFQVDVEIANLSSNDSFAPWVYVTVGSPVDPNDATARADKGVFHKFIRKTEGLGTRNLSQYDNLFSMSSKETDVLTTAFVLNEKQVNENPTIVVWVEVIGASSEAEHDLKTKDKRLALFNFMRSADGIRHTFNAIGPWPKAADGTSGYDNAKRKDGDPRRKNRCIYHPPSNLLESPDSVDEEKTKEFSHVLDGTIAWDRYVVISLTDTK